MDFDDMHSSSITVVYGQRVGATDRLCVSYEGGGQWTDNDAFATAMQNYEPKHLETRRKRR